MSHMFKPNQSLKRKKKNQQTRRISLLKRWDTLLKIMLLHQHDLGDDLAMLAMICCACIRRISSRLVETIGSRCHSAGTDVVFVFGLSCRVRGEAVGESEEKLSWRSAEAVQWRR